MERLNHRAAVCCVRCAVLILITMLLVAAQAGAQLAIPTDTAAQRRLNYYIEVVNQTLMSVGQRPVNSMFLCTEDMAFFGVTDEDDAEVPQGVEITVTMYSDSLNMLTLRATDLDTFAAVAAACIYAAAPQGTTYQAELRAVRVYTERIRSARAADHESSFRDTVNEQNGESVRTYYAYYMNQYVQNEHWLQLTIVFPMSGYDNGTVLVTPEPGAASTPAPDDEYEGFLPIDVYTHFEVFATPTPEPDSAVYSE